MASLIRRPLLAPTGRIVRAAPAASAPRWGALRAGALVALTLSGCGEERSGEAPPPASTGIATAAHAARGVDSAYRAPASPAPNLVHRGPTPDEGEEAPPSSPLVPTPGGDVGDPFAPVDPKAPAGPKPGGKDGGKDGVAL